MSEQQKRHIETASQIAALVLAALAFGKAWFTLPYRIDQAENAIASQSISRSADHELLVRIDERLKDVQRNLDAVTPGKRDTSTR